MNNNLEISGYNFEGASCPVPLTHNDQIVMSHGSGGQLTHELIKQIFVPELKSEPLLAGNDFACASLPIDSCLQGQIVISTDSHIINPLVFPGGDIGRLAICGTVNDVSMSGAIPLFITAGFILEEGFEIKVLQSIVSSMKTAMVEAGVQMIAGDTKVVEKGKGDRLFINTTGFGWLPAGINIGGNQAREGDVVLISGTLGDHGIAVLSARGEMGIEVDIKSDVAPLNHLIQAVLKAAPSTHVLRDPTRGGLATTLNEISVQSKVSILLNEPDIPVDPAVKSACEMLGFDPLYVANEGKVIVIVPPEEADAALEAMHRNPYGKMAMRIGVVVSSPKNSVLLKTPIGGTRIVPALAGEILPRIC